MRNAIQDTFSNLHAVLPVIHVVNYEQALRNTTLALDAGCDGVFLIDHKGINETLLQIAQDLQCIHVGKWIGVNCLGWSPRETFLNVPALDGVWCDNADIKEKHHDQPYPAIVRTLQQQNCPNTLYFGGVAFKYQRPVEDLENAARIASAHMDVVTTSGAGTGESAPLDKIRRMKQALDGGALAIASGITPENVADYLPFADAFLVATSISSSFEELDPVKTRELVKRVRG